MSTFPAKDYEIDRPILCFGTGRGGTTLFLRVLSEHPDLAWFSNYTRLFRHKLFFPLAFLSRFNDLPGIGEALPYEWKIRPKPRESNKLYRAMTHRTFTQPRPLDASDADDEQKKAWRQAVRAHLKWHGKPRFVNKHTGFPRCHYFLEIFPDARFIHVLRDGRAVANSLLNIGWWDGTIENSWWWGDMNPAYVEEFEASGKQPVVLAGIVWKTLMHFNEAELAQVDSRQKLEVNYSDFVFNPIGIMDSVREYCDLPKSAVFERRIKKIHIRSADNKWKQDLSTDQKKLLMKTIGADLEHFGFDV